MSVDLEKVKKAKGFRYVYIDESEPISVDDHVAYKGIEKEIGISLITLFKALTNGIWVKDEDGKCYHDFHISLECCGGVFYLTAENMTYKKYLKDYGKTWALTKEELE